MANYGREFEWGEIVVRREVKEEEEYKRMELPGKYTAKVLYGWDDKRFEKEYLNKLEGNWRRWKNNREKADKEEEQVASIIWGKKTEVSPEEKP